MVKTTATNVYHVAHLLYGIYFLILLYEPVYGQPSLEKMAMVF